jgi:peroxidase
MIGAPTRYRYRVKEQTMRHYRKVAAVAYGCLATGLMSSPSPAQDSHSIPLLEEFRPIGGGGNNLHNPALDAVPGGGELALAPLAFASGTHNRLLNGPNARTISNLVSGGSGSNGVDAESTDPSASAWLYLFGQFVDHDLDLESTPAGGAAINIAVPAGDPVFAAGTVIAVTRDERSAASDTIINTVAGYLDLSQLYGSTLAIASSLRNSDGTLKSSGRGTGLAGGKQRIHYR